LLGAEEKAVTLANETRARFGLVEHMRPRTAKPPCVLFILSLQNGRLMVGGRATAADVILKMNNANMVGGKDDIFALPAFSATPAAANRALIGMDGLHLLGFGPLSKLDVASAADPRRPAVSVSIEEIRGDVSLEADSRRRVFLTTAGLVALLASARCFRSPMALSRSRADGSPISSSARSRRVAPIRRRTLSSSLISDCRGSSLA
jgi:hypothetical protein